MNKLNNNNLLIVSGIIIALVLFSFLSINSQVKAHGVDDEITGTGHDTHCMGANLSREDFTKFHEEMWNLMEKYHVNDDLEDNEIIMDRSNMNYQDSSMMDGFNMMGMGSMMN